MRGSDTRAERRGHRVAAALSRALRRAWWWLRQVSGDAAYENYLRGVAAKPIVGQAHGHVQGRVLSQTEFFVERLKRKYAGVSRCC